jgi:cytochrome c oxidase assembly factor CtaG
VTAVALVASLWIWHLPAPFLAAVRTAPLHGLEHVCLLSAAIAFWTSVVALARRPVPGAGALAVVAVAIANTAFAAAITLWPRPVYATSLTHQQVAGVVMWAGGGLAYTGTLVVLFARWLAGAGPLARAAGSEVAARAFASSFEGIP